MKNKVIIISSIAVTLIGIVVCLGFMFFEFKLIGNKKMELSYKEKYVELGASAKVFSYDLSKNIKIDSNLDNSKVGKYDINYYIELGFIPFTLTRKVSIVDSYKPVLTLIGENEVKICPNAKYEEEGYSAIDEYDGDITSKVEVIDNESSIKYKVSDSSNNSVVVERNIIREDLDKPTIKLNSGSAIYLKKGNTYKERGFVASDNCDGDLTNNVTVSGVVDVNTIGTYTITYSVKDSSGNTTTVKRKVVVNEDTTSSDKGIPGVIYLTFDDGPTNGGSTAKILDVLRDNGVQATFFVTRSGSDDLIRRMNNEGHTVALHTYTHEYKDIYSSVDNFFSDLTKIQNRVRNITGKTVTITRFPGGSNNTVSNKYNKGIMKILREEVGVRGFKYYDWNVDSNDAGTCAKSSVKDKKTCVYNNVVNNLSKSRPNMVLMHDIKSYTAEAIDNIIKYGKDKGYVFLPIDDTTTQVKFK